MAALDSPKVWRADGHYGCASSGWRAGLAAGAVTANGPALVI
jgi:hypothetical protein